VLQDGSKTYTLAAKFCMLSELPWHKETKHTVKWSVVLQTLRKGKGKAIPL
jgi:hypothetical protein